MSMLCQHLLTGNVGDLVKSETVAKSITNFKRQEMKTSVA